MKPIDTVHMIRNGDPIGFLNIYMAESCSQIIKTQKPHFGLII
jgi:hypothetical protein